MTTLWRWNRKKAEWEWTVECRDEPDVKKVTLRGFKRRNPIGSVFRWTADGAPPARKYRQRAAKETG